MIARASDPRYRHARVYLDGIQISDVRRASEDEGFAEVYRLNDRGLKYMDNSTCQPAMETKHGTIRIERAVIGKDCPFCGGPHKRLTGKVLA